MAEESKTTMLVKFVEPDYKEECSTTGTVFLVLGGATAVVGSFIKLLGWRKRRKEAEKEGLSK